MADCFRFLIAKYQTDHILKGSLRRLRKNKTSIFNSMPRTVNQYFETSLKRINESADSTMALNALMWISNATRPLHIDELSAALAFKEGISVQDAYDAEEVENACIGLVIVDRKNNFCRLAHQTVQEYLITKTDWTKNANFLIAETALKYITGFKVDCFLDESSLNIHLERNILYEYAAKNWGTHMKGCDEEQNLTLIPILDAFF